MFDKLVSFDLETTGVDPNSARIVTSSMLRMDFTTGTVDDMTLIADPGIEIPEGAAKVHGFTTERARAEGAPHDEVLKKTIDVLNYAWNKDMPVVVYNAAYDLSLLTAQEPSFEIGGLVLDPLVIDKAVDKYRRGSRKLIDTAAHYGIELKEEDAHGSAADSMAAARIAWKLVNDVLPHNDQRVPGTDFTFAESLKSPDLLMEMQTKCAYEQRKSLEEYFIRQGKLESPIDRGWPVQNSTLNLRARNA